MLAQPTLHWSSFKNTEVYGGLHKLASVNWIFLGVRDTQDGSLETSGSRCKNHGTSDRGALGKSSQLAHSTRSALIIYNIQHTEYIVACWILALDLPVWVLLHSSTTFLSGSAVYISPFYAFCVMVIILLGAGLVFWFLLLFSDRPLGSHLIISFKPHCLIPHFHTLN